MQFTYRNPDRSTDPSRTLVEARSIVVGARAYAADVAGERTGLASGPQGRVAAYARHDHYSALKASLNAIAERLRDSGWRAHVLVDDNALVDREAAYRAGLGWYGKNSNLLLPGRGSWFVLGSVVTNAALELDDAPLADGCGGCRRCITGCPTNAIVAPGMVDARRCLAWLLQMAGDFPREHRVALGDRIYGCDDCQEVCPHNGPAHDRQPAATNADADDETSSAYVSIVALLTDDDDTLLERHRQWYIAERSARHLRRNALIVLGNIGDGRDPDVERLLDAYLDHPDSMLRSHAAWAARRMGREDLLAHRMADPAIAGELAAVAPPAR
jgi:epoxyqueuosine reductase